jgi:pimeloyl-ACP methyl ester carboxylesterase
MKPWALVQLISLSLSLAAAGTAQGDWTDKSPHRQGFVTVNGVRLHYLDWGGRGEVILFLHGLGDTPHIFDDLAPKFTDHFRVIGLTRRGHGQSDKPDGGYDTATLVEDIRQFLDALSVPRVILVGHSIAGDEMTRFAGEHPDRTIKLVYLDAAQDWANFIDIMKEAPPEFSPAKGDMESLDSFRQWLTRMSYWSDAWEANLREMMVCSPEGKILREVKPDRASRLLMQGTMESHPDYGKIKAPALNMAAVGFSSKIADFVKTLAKPRRAKAEDYLGRVRGFQLREIERFRKEVPTGKVVELPDTDHHCFIQKENEVARRMRTFLVE